MRIIKKYSNRKLYDTVTHRYISLKGVLNLVDTVKKISIIDNVSKKDITKSVVLSALQNDDNKLTTEDVIDFVRIRNIKSGKTNAPTNSI